MVKRLRHLIPAMLFIFLANNTTVSPEPKLESSPPERIIEYSEGQQNPISKRDLTIEFLLGTHSVGDELNYLGKIKNLTSSRISIKPNERKGLEWELWKDGELFTVQRFKENITMILEKRGSIELGYEGGKLKVGETRNANIKYGAMSIPKFLLNFVLANINAPAYIFEESGRYSIRFSLAYSKDGEEHLMTHESKMFTVLDK